MGKKSKKVKNKKNLMVGLLVLAMLAFIGGQIPWNKFKQAAPPTKTNSTTKNMASTIANKSFEPVGAVSITDAEGKEKSKVRIEFVNNEADRNLGMMYRRNLPQDAGMLFQMEIEKEQNFWMKNTPLSLDIIYINKAKEIVSIAKSTVPNSEQSIPSNAPALYALEVNSGYTAIHDIQVGDKISFTLD